MKRLIIIMAKVPRAGNVKTRLHPFISTEQCRTLSEAFIFDAITKAHNFGDELIIAFAPAAEKSYFAEWKIENLTLIEQQGANLGEKMFHAFDFAFSRNSDASVVLIGADSPTFPPQFIENAFEKLESKAEIVLGKSADGGFYLIGLRKIVPHLFDHIEWSSPLVYEQISRSIEKSQIDLETIPEWFDVDNPNDLRRLRDEILNDERSQKYAPETFRWLISNANSFSTSDRENKS